MKAAASARAVGSSSGRAASVASRSARKALGVRRARRGAGGGDGGVGPVGEVLVHQRQVEQPLAGVVDDVEVDDARAGPAGEEAGGGDAQRQAQGGDRAGALGPVRVGGGQGGEVVLVGEARDGVVGLRLQVGGLDAALGGGAELRHAAAVEQVGDQRGDEHGLAGAAEAGDAEPDRVLEQRAAELAERVLEAAEEAAGPPVEIQGRVLPSPRRQT